MHGRATNSPSTESESPIRNTNLTTLQHKSRQWGFGFGNSQLTNRRTSLTHSRQYDPLDGCGINIAISNYYITVVTVNIISLTRKFTDNNKDEILKFKVISIFCQFL